MPGRKYTVASAVRACFVYAPGTAALKLLLELLSGVLSPVMVLVVASFIDRAIAFAGGGGSFAPMAAALGGMAAYYAFTQITPVVTRLADKALENALRENLRPLMILKHGRIAYPLLEDAQTADMIAHVCADTEARMAAILGDGLMLLKLGIQAGGTLWLLASHVWWLPPLFVVCALPMLFIARRGGQAIYAMDRQTTILTRRHYYLSGVMVGRETAAERTLFRFTDHINGLFTAAHLKRSNLVTKRIAIELISVNACGLILNALVAVAVFTLLLPAGGGGISHGLYVSLIGALIGLARMATGGVSQLVREAARHVAYMKDYTCFFRLPEGAGGDEAGEGAMHGVGTTAGPGRSPTPGAGIHAALGGSPTPGAGVHAGPGGSPTPGAGIHSGAGRSPTQVAGVHARSGSSPTPAGVHAGAGRASTPGAVTPAKASQTAAPGSKAQSKAESALAPEPSPTPLFTRLEIRNLRFRYTPDSPYVLDGVTLTMEQGRSYSLIGENGAGKSTLTKILLGLYRDFEGEILINGVDIARYADHELRGLFSIVYQDFARYYISLRDNITLGGGGENLDSALRLAGLNEVAALLPRGADTPLGVIFEGGADISGGEWQKVAIARALNVNAPFMILDEPTASLSPMMESRLYHDFARITGGKTSLLISHRLGSTKLSDVLFVLNNGVIAETGTHSQLMAASGVYAAMFASQRSWYDER